MSFHVTANVLFLFPIFLQFSSSTENVVRTPSGSIEGIVHQYENVNIYQFRNIPYAKPPVGDLRFRKPQPFGIWSGVRDGTHFGPSCMQDMSYLNGYALENRNISEDCLSLNIYTPYDISNRSQRNKTVMIWVHGGGLIVGQGEFFDATALAAKGDVVVVTINYRLGLFGFLSTEDSACLGNFGLWDQILAFQWVKVNIESFGGNPDSITIFGQSAGGWSVSFHSLFVQNKGLFQRVIAQSGVSNSNAAVAYDALYFAKKYGVLLGCINSTNDHVDTEFLVSCMRHKSSKELLSAELPNDLASYHGYRFPPQTRVVVYKELLVDLPETIIRNGDSDSFRMFQSIDFMTGNCNSEGSLVLFDLANKSKTSHFNLSVGVPTSILCNYVGPGLAHDLYPNNNIKSERVANAVCNEYRSEKPDEQGNKVVDLLGDMEFIVPAIDMLNAHSKDNNMTKSYQYLFNRPSVLSPNEYKWFKGSAHAAELPYLFGNNWTLPQTEHLLFEEIIRYWTNFAKTGDPNGAGLHIWPTYNSVERSYLNLDTTVTTRNHMFNDRVNFWTKYLPQIEHGISIIIGK